MPWIKTETTLFEKPEVLRMSSILYPNSDGSDGCDIVAAKLQRFWIWADSNSSDGTSMMVDCATINKIVGKAGFAEAMRVVGWLVGEDWSLSIPNFSRHNGDSSKRRAESAKRQSAYRSRNADSNAGCVTKVTRCALPREDKIREDKKEETPPLSPLVETCELTLSPDSNKHDIETQWTKSSGWQNITPEKKKRWKLAYPACDIDRQLAEMDAWLSANPAKAHKSRWDSFIVNWMKRSQDRGGDCQSRRPAYGKQRMNVEPIDYSKGFWGDKK